MGWPCPPPPSRPLGRSTPSVASCMSSSRPRQRMLRPSPSLRRSSPTLAARESALYPRPLPPAAPVRPYTGIHVHTKSCTSLVSATAFRIEPSQVLTFSDSVCRSCASHSTTASVSPLPCPILTETVGASPPIVEPALPASLSSLKSRCAIWAHQSGQPGHFAAPKLTNLNREPTMSA